MSTILYSPLEQFSIMQEFTLFLWIKVLVFLFNFDFSFTVFLIENINNFFLFFLIITLYLTVANNFNLSFNYLSLITLYKFVFNILSQQIKDKKHLEAYFVLATTVFLFILVNNLFGMIPYSFVSTAQLGQNFFLSSSLIVFFTILGFKYLNKDFLLIFVPSAPKIMLPFLVLIELISYSARMLSLSIRLFANLMSGHTLLFILCAFNSVILSYNFFSFFIASIIILLIFGLELVIAFMQAYVFTVLISVYLKDSTSAASH